MKTTPQTQKHQLWDLFPTTDKYILLHWVIVRNFDSFRTREQERKAVLLNREHPPLVIAVVVRGGMCVLETLYCNINVCVYVCGDSPSLSLPLCKGGLLLLLLFSTYIQWNRWSIENMQTIFFIWCCFLLFLLDSTLSGHTVSATITNPPPDWHLTVTEAAHSNRVKHKIYICLCLISSVGCVGVG